mgnify:CR=1 FL=1
MKFTRQQLIDSLDEGEEVLSEICDTSRWSIQYRRVFKFEGKFYETFYSVGATEQQEESPYEYAPEIIDCPEVVPVQRFVTVYEQVAPTKETNAQTN